MPVGQSLSLQIPNNSQRAKDILTNLYKRWSMSAQKMSSKLASYEMAEERFVAYMPEREADARRKAYRESGKPQFTTLVIPYSYAILMTAHTYWTSVFLSRAPIFQFQARHGEAKGNEQALEALIDYQCQVGQWLVPLYIWLMDVGKYGDGILGYYWDEETIPVTQIVEKPDLYMGIIPTGKTKKVKQTANVPGYCGNRLYNVRPAHWFPDVRRPLHRFQEGEFAIRYVEMGWNELKKKEARGEVFNLEDLKKSGMSNYMSSLGSAQIDFPTVDNALLAAGLGANDKTMSDGKALLEIYIELIPKDWGLGSSDYPEKWVFLVDVQWSTLVGARPLGALHGKYQFANMQLEPDGYSLASRGMMEILQPLQDTMDWLINTHFYNVRKTLNDQVLVDPSKIVMKDLLDPLPGGIIRMSPRGYGTDPRLAIQQLQMSDITQVHLADADRVAQLIQRVSGVTDSIMGLMGGSSRKTAQEVRTTTGFGTNRLKTQTEYFSAMGWGPLAQGLVSNTQQYLDITRQYRVVGDLRQAGLQQSMTIGPEDIAGFFDWVPVDGTLPVDRYAQAALWQQMLANIQRYPQVMMQFDIAGIFAWVAQLAGLKNINQFRIQVVPDQAAVAGAQAGNLLSLGDYQSAGGPTAPIAGGTGAPSGAAPGGLGTVPEPGQIPGMGTTG